MNSVSFAFSYQPPVLVENSLTHLDFPCALVDAVGRKKLEDMPEYLVDQPLSLFSNDPFSLENIPPSGAIKGRDLSGRVFITFAVNNENHETITQDRLKEGLHFRGSAEKVVLVSVYPRFVHEGDVNQMPMYNTWSLEIPTNDERFFEHSPEDCSPLMTSNKYQMLREIFQGAHKDLRLGKI